MILNIWTINAFFLAFVGVTLALAAGVVATRSLLAVRRNPDRTGFDAFEDRAHLIALIVAVLAVVRLLAWPHFYLLLKSYVPDLALYGVMCAFGVTRVEPGLVGALQWLKPVLLLMIGFWWLLAVADRRADGATLLTTRIALTIPIAVVAIGESVVETVYLVREKAGQPVTCCTQFLDTEAASISANLSPIARLGATPPWVSLSAYLLLTLVVVVVCWRLARTRRGWGPVTWVGLAGLAIANLLVTQWGWIDAVAPRVLRLPYHHCIYELITDMPALGVAALLVVIGNGMLVWPAGLALWRRRAPEAIGALQREVCAAGGVALGSALLIVVVQLV